MRAEMELGTSSPFSIDKATVLSYRAYCLIFVVKPTLASVFQSWRILLGVVHLSFHFYLQNILTVLGARANQPHPWDKSVHTGRSIGIRHDTELY